MTVKQMTDWFYLAFTVYREARGASRDAQVAVAYSIMERVKHSGWWGNSVDSVVTKRFQYSSLTDPHDPQLYKSWPRLTEQAWIQCCDIADAVGAETVTNPAPGADSYYDTSIPPPFWATPDNFIAAIGNLKFHKVRKES